MSEPALLDREDARVVGIGFYASAGHAEEADALSSPPESFGLYEVVHRD